MSYHYDRDILISLLNVGDSILYFFFRPGIQGRGGFIQDENFRLLNDGSRNGYSLLLSSAQVHYRGRARVGLKVGVQLISK